MAFVRRPSLQVLSILLELSVPPLGLMVAITTITALVLAGVSYAVGSWSPLLSYLAIAAAAAAGSFPFGCATAAKSSRPTELLQNAQVRSREGPHALAVCHSSPTGLDSDQATVAQIANSHWLTPRRHPFRGVAPSPETDERA